MTTTRATSFGAWADEYDDHRPTYPDDAVDWLLPPHAARVAEVGVDALPLGCDAVCIRWSPDGGAA